MQFSHNVDFPRTFQDLSYMNFNLFLNQNYHYLLTPFYTKYLKHPLMVSKHACVISFARYHLSCYNMHWLAAAYIFKRQTSD